MAPPKVSLAVKTPAPENEAESEPQVYETDVNNEKCDKLDLPPIALVTVDSERDGEVHTLRTARRQSYRRMACGIMLITMVAIAALGTVTLVHRLRNRHRKFWECRYGKGQLPEHVTVDHENQLIYAKRDPDHMSHAPALHVLHEYDRRLVAYKDEELNICYIDRLEETFEEGYTRWLSYERHGHHESHGHHEGRTLARVSETPIEREVLRHVGDVHIYAHCESATSFWYMEIEEEEVTTAEVVHV